MAKQAKTGCQKSIVGLVELSRKLVGRAPGMPQLLKEAEKGEVAIIVLSSGGEGGIA